MITFQSRIAFGWKKSSGRLVRAGLAACFLALSAAFAAGGSAGMQQAETGRCVWETFQGQWLPAAEARKLVIDSVALRAAGPSNVEFCRIKAHVNTIIPIFSETTDRQVQMEIRLPSQWNQKYLQYGGTVFDGGIASVAFVNLSGSTSSDFGADIPTYSPAVSGAPAQPLNRGYAIAATDAGHSSSPSTSAAWLSYNGMDRWANYAHRARHLLAVTAKAMMRRYYGQGPVVSYHGGLSGGGRNGMVAAQRYPEDFDGILATSPVLEWGGYNRNAAYVRNMQKQFPVDTDHPVFPMNPDTMPGPLLKVLGNITMARCDAEDGLKDGILSDPAHCSLDVDVDLPRCPSEVPDNATCFTALQRDFLKTIYSPAVLNGKTVYPRYLPNYQGDAASQYGSRVVGQASPLVLPFQYRWTDQSLKYLIFGNPLITLQDIRLDDPATARAFSVAPSGFDLSLAGVTPDFTAFRALGGKMILVQGLADPQVSPIATLEFYHQLAEASGGIAQTRDFARLFLAPGLGHSGQPTAAGAPAIVDYLAPLERWVEQGMAPDYLSGANTVPAPMTRPICAYPFRAVYTGPAGDEAAMRLAGNFECRSYEPAGLNGELEAWPAKNAVYAGDTVEVAIRVGTDWGPNIFADGYPLSVEIPCEGLSSSLSAPVAAAEVQPDRLAGESCQTTYKYCWVTEPEWRGTCRQLILRLNDGTNLKANFRLKPADAPSRRKP